MKVERVDSLTRRDTRGAASQTLYRSGRGKSVNPASNAEYWGSPQPRQRGALPL